MEKARALRGFFAQNPATAADNSGGAKPVPKCAGCRPRGHFLSDSTRFLPQVMHRSRRTVLFLRGHELEACRLALASTDTLMLTCAEAAA